jgi:ribosomal protein S12 methylthiotransferase
VKKQRYQKLMKVQQKVSSRLLEKKVGKSIKVLIEQEQELNVYLGRSEADAPDVDGLVYVQSKRRLQPGTFVTVTIIDHTEYDLIGEA